MFIVRHVPLLSNHGELCSNTEVGPFKLALRQALNVLQVGIGQIGAVEPCQTQIAAAQIGCSRHHQSPEAECPIRGLATVGTGSAGILLSAFGLPRSALLSEHGTRLIA